MLLAAVSPSTTPNLLLMCYICVTCFNVYMCVYYVGLIAAGQFLDISD